MLLTVSKSSDFQILDFPTLIESERLLILQLSSLVWTGLNCKSVFVFGYAAGAFPLLTMMPMKSDICWWSMSGTLNNFTSPPSLSPPVHIQVGKIGPSMAVLHPVTIINSSCCDRQHLHGSITTHSVNFCPLIANQRKKSHIRGTEEN